MRDAERARATELFGTFDEPSALASKIMGIKSRTFDVASTATGAGTGAGGFIPEARSGTGYPVVRHGGLDGLEDEDQMQM